MSFALDIKTGPRAGQQIALTTGLPVTVGRTRAAAAFGEDSAMSGLHFEVVTDGERVALKNHSQTNGTLVNGQRAEKMMLQPGDLISAGGTQFQLVICAQTMPGEIRILNWRFQAIPEGWEVVGDQGLRFVRDGAYVTTIIVSEEPLPDKHDLEKYIDIQCTVLAKQLPKTVIKKEPAKVPQAEASAGLALTTPLGDGRTGLQKQVYAEVKGQAGVLTATIYAEEPPEVHRAVALILGHALFDPPELPAKPAAS